MSKTKDQKELLKKQEDLQKRVNLANKEIGEICLKYQVILRTRLNYTTEKIFASLEYVDNKK